MLAFPACNTNLQEMETLPTAPSLASMTILFHGELTSASVLITPGLHPRSRTCLLIWEAHVYPFSPTKAHAKPKREKYSKGQSVIINCTQSFDAIPAGYSNVITAFDEDDYPLGFSTKVPLSSPNLQRQ